MATQTVSFSTTGEGLTETIRDLIQSGSFWNAIEILKDGGLQKEHVLAFLLGQLKFEGDTRDGNGLDVLSDDTNLEYELIISGWHTLIGGDEFRRYQPYDFYAFEGKIEENKHLKSLTDIIPLETIKSLIWKDLLRREGYTVYEKAPQQSVHNGVILRNGFFVECGYHDHVNLYPVLNALGLADSGRWVEDESVIHITERQIVGAVGYSIENYYPENIVHPSEEQIDALFNWKDHFPYFYGFEKTRTINALRHYIIKSTNKGAKYGNLVFLKRFYGYNIPEISLEPFESNYCIRTSPKYSIAGLLNSKFDINENSEEEIWLDWTKYKDIKEGNELSLFYQEYISGENGVAHYITKGDFNYSVSDNRGDIVNGKKGTTIMSPDNYLVLRKICRELHEDLGEQIQVEFVIRNEEVWIVQLRTIKTPHREDFNIHEYKGFLYAGKSFTSGCITCNKSEVLIVSEDCSSEALIGKKALIVTQDIEFSHILALSQSLNIPSIYGVEITKELPDTFTIDTRHKTGVITKSS